MKKKLFIFLLHLFALATTTHALQLITYISNKTYQPLYGSYSLQPYTAIRFVYGKDITTIYMKNYAIAYAIFSSSKEDWPGGTIYFNSAHGENICRFSAIPSHSRGQKSYYVVVIPGTNFVCWNRNVVYQDNTAILTVTVSRQDPHPLQNAPVVS